MIIVKLSGGLGNQMFQYAFGKKLSIINNTELKIYYHQEKGEIKRYYALGCFGITENYENNLLNKIRFMSSRIVIVKELTPNFDPKNLCLNNHNYYIDGYWQSYKYFEDNKNQIREIFKFKKEIKLNLIKNSVSVHIRRGDYLNNYDHDSITKSYYNRAISLICKKISNPCLYFFSDDIGWVKSEFGELQVKKVFVDDHLSDCQSLRLMSQCENNIIANSSFSWWGAYLNKNKNKIVISPKKWFKKTKFNINDRIPPEWLKI